MSEDPVRTPELERDEEIAESEFLSRVPSLKEEDADTAAPNKSKVHMRASAPEFVPEGQKTVAQQEEVLKLLEAQCFVGMNVRDIPRAYLEKYKKPLDLSYKGGHDLSAFLHEMEPGCVFGDSSSIPDSLREALVMAGFAVNNIAGNDSGEIIGCRDPGLYRPRSVPSESFGYCPLGPSADKVVVSKSYSKYVHELKTFRESIVEVITSFAKSSSIPGTGLSLSLFSSEWDKFFVSKGLSGMPDLKSLRDRFGVAKLMLFLQGIPGLEVTGTHPEIRVKAKPAVLVSAQTASLSSKSLALHEELFGGRAAVANHISLPLVKQLAGQVDRQVLELGSYLATKGFGLSSQDLVKIRLQLQQLQALKTALEGVQSMGGVSAKPAAAQPGSEKYVTLLAQAAQFAMSAISGRPPTSGVSTAATSRKESPQMTPTGGAPAAPAIISESDLRSLLTKVVERASSGNRAGDVGIAVSHLPAEWMNMYPSLPRLDAIMENLKITKLKHVFVRRPHLIVFYSTLPVLQQRVATRSAYAKLLGVSAVTSRSPLISPSSTCSYTSDGPGRGVQPESADTSRMLLELVLSETRKQQVAAVARASKPLLEIYEWIQRNFNQNGRQRLLDSRRPPPIDTGSGQTSSGSLVRQFTAGVTELSQRMFDGVDLGEVAKLWEAEYAEPAPTDIASLVHASGALTLVNGSSLVVSALSPPGAAIASLFQTFDGTTWSRGNAELVALVEKFLRPPPAPGLSDLSSLLFRSIMAGGPQMARECAESLRLLAARDPQAIHAVVSQYVGKLGNASADPAAAAAFVKSLVEKGKAFKEASVAAFNPRSLLSVRAALGDRIAAPPPGLAHLKLVQN